MSIDSLKRAASAPTRSAPIFPSTPRSTLCSRATVPSGRLHSKYYFGTIRERVALQDMGITTRIIIADYQVITDRDTTEHIQDNVYNMVVDYLACGIDPAKI